MAYSVVMLSLFRISSLAFLLLGAHCSLLYVYLDEYYN